MASRARRRAVAAAPGSARSPGAAVVASSATTRERYAGGRRAQARGSATIARARRSGHFHAMPNIKQQKKRVRTAAERAPREPALPLDDQDAGEAPAPRRSRTATPTAVETEHRALVKLIDRAVARGALHRNAGARKKSQAARARRSRAVAMPRPRGALRSRLCARPALRDLDQRALELELGRRREPPFSAWSSSARRTVASAQLVAAEVARLRVELLRRRTDAASAAPRPPSRDSPSASSALARADARDVAREDADEPRDRARARVAGALEHLLGGAQDRRDVARAPGVGEREVRRLGARRDERLDVGRGDALAAPPTSRACRPRRRARTGRRRRARRAARHASGSARRPRAA